MRKVKNLTDLCKCQTNEAQCDIFTKKNHQFSEKIRGNIGAEKIFQSKNDSNQND